MYKDTYASMYVCMYVCMYDLYSITTVCLYVCVSGCVCEYERMCLKMHISIKCNSVTLISAQLDTY